MENKIPKYLISRKNIITLVIFTAIFALVFINVYAPFNVNSWFEVTKIELFLYSSLVILTGMLVVVISRVIMYLFCRISLINYWQYALWVLVEILSMAFVYSIFVKFILVDSRDFIDIWSVSIKNTSLVLIIPYVLTWMYFSWKEKNEKLDRISEKEASTSHSNNIMLPFYDEKGTMRITIKQDDLIYLSAADNYVSIHYLVGNKVSKLLIRNSMKFFENEFKELNIIRCHRSYIVNFNKVKMIRKDSDGLQIDLDADPIISLPVSKKYSDDVMMAFSRYASL